MSIDLEAISARAEAATPGPWAYVDNGFDGYIMSASEHLIVGGEPAEGRIEPDDPNADFIAHAREDVPALLAEVKRLVQGKQELIENREKWIKAHGELSAEVERLNSEMQLENTQPKPDDKCREDDGCPTENAVLRREWRKLTAQLASVTAERDAAVADITHGCDTCARCEDCEVGTELECAHCYGNVDAWNCNEDCWEWRGAGKEQNDATIST